MIKKKEKQRGLEMNFCNALDCLDCMFHVITGKKTFGELKTYHSLYMLPSEF